MEDKATLRRLYARRRDNVPHRVEAEKSLRDNLFSLAPWKDASLICGFLSVRNEPDTKPILECALAEGKAVALPVTLTDAREGCMVFRKINQLNPTQLTTARYGLTEPAESCPTLPWEAFEDALILVPGLAFDDEGYRIGYGGSYYDRFLAELRLRRIPHTTVGLTFSVCRPASLPHEAFDLPVDYILDERRITVTNGAS